MLFSIKRKIATIICLMLGIVFFVAIFPMDSNVAYAKSAKLKVTSVSFKNGQVIIKGKCPKKTTIQLSYSKYKIKKKFKGKRFIIKTQKIKKPIELKIRKIKKGKPCGKAIRIKKARYVSKRPSFVWVDKFNNRDDRVLVQFEVKAVKGANIIIKQGTKKLKQKKNKSKKCSFSLTVLSGSKKIRVYSKQPGKMISSKREIAIPDYMRNESIFSNKAINSDMLKLIKNNKDNIFSITQYSKARSSKKEQYIFFEDGKLVSLWEEKYGKATKAIETVCKSGIEINILDDRVIFVLRGEDKNYLLIYDWEYDFSYSQSEELKMKKLAPYWFYKEQ